MNKKINTLKSNDTNRFILPSQQVPKDSLIMTWAVAYETLLLSSLEHPDFAATIWITDNLKKTEPYLKADNYFLGEFNQIPIEDLPTRYFNLGEGRYEILEK